MSLKLSFSRAVYLARINHGLTQQQVAEAVSISVRWYQQIEKGVCMPGSTTLLRLLLLLHIDPQIFRTEADLSTPVPSR